MQGGSTAQKAQTTKHSHTYKGGVQRKKHKLQNTVTHARGEYSAKITNYKTQSHMQGGSTAQKAQTTKHSHTSKGGVQRKKHKLQNVWLGKESHSARGSTHCSLGRLYFYLTSNGWIIISIQQSEQLTLTNLTSERTIRPLTH